MAQRAAPTGLCVLADPQRVSEALALAEFAYQFAALTPRCLEAFRQCGVEAVLLEDFSTYTQWDSVNEELALPYIAEAKSRYLSDGWSHFLVSEMNAPYLLGKCLLRLMEALPVSRIVVIVDPDFPELTRALLHAASVNGVPGETL